MATIYDIDYNIFSTQLLPPDKRRRSMLAWMKSLLSSLQYSRDLYLGSFKDGSTVAQYAAGTYNQGNRVIYYQSVYESLVNNNTALPTDQTRWVRVQENFIGVTERAQYNGQKIILEYALNKWFNTQFRQPPAQSDIYITKSLPPAPVFRVGGVESNTSTMYYDRSTEYVIDSYSFAAVNKFIINIPSAVYTNIDPIATNRDGVVRNFVNNYVQAGGLYTIQTY